MPNINYNKCLHYCGVLGRFSFYNKEWNTQLVTSFHSSCCLLKQVLKNAKGKSKSSQDWLTRQINDPYVERARILNYRCRSAFKLLEINKKYNILAAGHRVVDCGAAPGSWTQVAVHGVNSLARNQEAVGSVISIDCRPIYPIEGATILGNSDFTKSSTQDKLSELLKDRKVDVVLSDIAPNATGVRSLDHENIVHLAYTVFRFSAQVSTIGGTFLVKLWDGSDVPQFEKDLSKFYSDVKRIIPQASRSDSSELFVLARAFKGLK